MALWLSPPLSAQEIEIRRWNHLPIDGNFVTANFGRTDGDIAVDPVLRLDDVSVEMDTWLLGYIRTFELFDRTARVEIRQAWQAGLWNGVVDGIPTKISREGWSDTFARFAVNLVGAPPLTGKAYADYRAAAHVETIVGAALGVQLPTGQYLEDKLINLGSNRFTFSPQVGVHQQYYNWSLEATGTAWIYTDNTSFFDGNQLEQDPYYTMDGSVEYKFQSGIWASAGAGIGIGGQSTVNGVKKDNRREDWVSRHTLVGLQGGLFRDRSLGEGWNCIADNERRPSSIVVTQSAQRWLVLTRISEKKEFGDHRSGGPVFEDINASLTYVAK